MKWSLLDELVWSRMVGRKGVSTATLSTVGKAKTWQEGSTASPSQTSLISGSTPSRWAWAQTWPQNSSQHGAWVASMMKSIYHSCQHPEQTLGKKNTANRQTGWLNSWIAYQLKMNSNEFLIVFLLISGLLASATTFDILCALGFAIYFCLLFM